MNDISTDIQSVEQFIRTTDDINKEFTVKTTNNKKPSEKKTMARLCVESGSIDSLELLLNNNCKTDLLIRSAVRYKQKDVLVYLINRGLDVNEYTERHSPALFVAVNGNLADYVRILLDSGADTSLLHKCQTVLTYATKLEQIEIFKLLLNAGAPISAYEPGIPPLISALKSRNAEAVSLLLSRGADPNCVQSQNSDSILRPIDVAIANKSFSQVKQLILMGADGSHISKNKVDQQIYDMIVKFSKKGSAKHHIDIETHLENLVKSFIPLEKKTDDVLNILELRAEDQRNDLTSVLNSVRELFVKFSEYVPLCVEFDKELSKEKQRYINSQIAISEARDREIFHPVLQNEEKSWGSFLNNVRNTLETSRNAQNMMFVEYCLQGIEEFRETFGSDFAKTVDWEPVSLPINCDIETTCDEIQPHLAELSAISSKFRSHLAIVDDAVSALQMNSNILLNEEMDRLNAAKERLSVIETDRWKFQRSGLSEQQINEIKDSLEPKRKVIVETLDQIRDNCASFSEMASLLLTLLRRHVC